MKLAIDLRPLQIGHENRGIGAYLINLLHNLPIDDSTHILYLRYDTSNPLTDFDLPLPKNYSEVTCKKRGFSKKPLGMLLFVLNQFTPKYLKLAPHRPDVFLQTDYLLGAPRLPGIRVVVVCYDLIPVKFRTMYLPSWRHHWRMRHFSFKARLRLSLRAMYYTNKYRMGTRLLKRCSKILSISQTTKNDLVELLGISPKKIKIIYLAPSIRDTKPSIGISSLVESIKSPYLLFVGGTDRRRRVFELVNAYNKIRARGIKCSLVLAGNEFTKSSQRLDGRTSEAIKLSSYSKDIHLTGSISEGDKYLLLKKARCFVYPSIYEGFGMPIIEALSLNTPVIAFRNNAVEEIAQEQVIYTDSYSSDDLADAIRIILASDAKTNSAQFTYSWCETASKTWQALLEK